MTGKHLVWFRNDLRVTDHPALSTAMDAAPGGVVACFCLSHAQWRSHDMGDARLALQLRALTGLAEELKRLGVAFRLLEAPWFADVPAALVSLCRELSVNTVHFIDEYPLNERRRDLAVSTRLSSAGVDVVRHLGDAVIEPGAVLTGEGKPYTVFTPFYRKWQSRLHSALAGRVARPHPQSPADVASDAVPDQLDGVRAELFADLWPASETHALEQLQAFVERRLNDYPQDRDLPGVAGTSSLSPYLAIGLLSARQCIHVALRHAALASEASSGADKWLAELAWRDFYRHVVAQFDAVSMGRAFRPEMDELPWRDASKGSARDELRAWQQGNTGYPLVDAAMRQLNTTGWMHNRLRMIAAMFLTKHLLIDWRLGERYFMRALVDGDFASNNGGWQWSASTGTDAAPYFRIFNPASQGEKFDPEGAFTRKFVPELQDVPSSRLFKPQDPAAGGYPAPIVEHKFARTRALAFFKANR